GFDIDTTMVRLGLMNLMMHGIDNPHIDYKDTLSKSFNEDSRYRKKLVDEAELKAVIAMPSGVFKPYAGVSTAILIFTKGGETREIWFYDMQSDGYSLDDKRNKQEGYGDLQDIVERYKNRNPEMDNDRSGKYFFVPKSEIVENEYDLSLSKYKEEVYEEVVYESPGNILASLNNIEKDIHQGIEELKVHLK
ncbi:MAG: N-6 DNA methylase, partial [Thermodesulfovibrionales bacterium]